MPSGRKSGTKVKGGGFGKSLLNARSKTATTKSLVPHDKPDHTRVRIQFNGSTDEQPNLTDFISKDKIKVSNIDGDTFDDFLAASFTRHDDLNLVIMQSGGIHLNVCPEPEIVKPQPRGTSSRASLFGHSSIFGTTEPVTTTPILGCPERPFAFRDPARRVICFAQAVAKRQSGAVVTSHEDLYAICNKVSDKELLATIEEYFSRPENSAVFLSQKTLERKEVTAFARWRSSIADAEAKICVTPYEKNFEYWKQLWRTIERSDIVLEIVDARNPLLFAASSLKAMTERQGRQHYLLMNKSDFLSPDQLRAWQTYFEDRKQKVIFYSALRELEDQRMHHKIIDETSPGVKLTKSALRRHECSHAPINTEDHLLEKLDDMSSPAASPSAPPSLSSDDDEVRSKGDTEQEEHWAGECAPTTERMRKACELYSKLVMNADELAAVLDEKSATLGASKWQDEHLAVRLWDSFNYTLANIEYGEKRRLYERLWRKANQEKDGQATECNTRPATTEFTEDATSQEPSLTDDSSDSENSVAHDTSTSSCGASSDVKQTDVSDLVVMPKDLKDQFLRILLGPRRAEPEETSICFSSPVIGTCGYPNVGKSSVINSLMRGTKRVGVSRTPGKTRHLQTLQVPQHQFVLCDCPGLIFPSAAANKEILLLNNILSPSTFRGSLLPAMGLVLEKLGMQVGQAYGLTEEFLTLQRSRGRPLRELSLECATAIAIKRKYFAAGRGGVPDVQRTCREVLKELHKGVIMWYIEPPPTA